MELTVAFAMPISLENAACDLLPRSVFMFFDSFFDSSTKITSD